MVKGTPHPLDKVIALPNDLDHALLELVNVHGLTYEDAHQFIEKARFLRTLTPAQLQNMGAA